MNLGIKNKVAVVTGGATGIGYAIAFDLAKFPAVIPLVIPIPLPPSIIGSTSFLEISMVLSLLNKVK